jgi:hypothetical protein
VITLIAEVSGFADLFVLGFGSLVGTLISPKMLQTQLINQMSFSVVRKKKKKLTLSRVQGRLGGKEVLQIVKVLTSRVRFRVNETLMLLSQFVPAWLREEK